MPWSGVTWIPLDRLLFGSHDMDWKHVEKWMNDFFPPPILVEEISPGWWFVHDGRHRATAAYELGQDTVATLPVTH